MDKEKRLDGLMKFAAVAYLLILFGFIEIAAAAYLLVLIGWLAREMYRGFEIGRIERKDYKEREKNWQTGITKVNKKASEQQELAEGSIANVAWGPL